MSNDTVFQWTYARSDNVEPITSGRVNKRAYLSFIARRDHWYF